MSADSWGKVFHLITTRWPRVTDMGIESKKWEGVLLVRWIPTTAEE